MATYRNCILEIDERRGVIYVHSETHGVTLLRICRLPTPIPHPIQTDRKVSKHTLIREVRIRALDITHMHGVSWAHGHFKED